jgi:hypothetical protein
LFQKTFNFKITSDDLDRTAIKVGKMTDCKKMFLLKQPRCKIYQRANFGQSHSYKTKIEK